MTVCIVTDSTCDLPDETIAEHGITVVPVYVTQGNKSYLDGIDLTRDEFYARLPDYVPPPQTAAPGPDAFERAYEALSKSGAEAILSLHISEALSATVNSAHVAAERFRKLPVTVLDSGQLSTGLGLLVELAARMARMGAGVEAILAGLHDAMRRTYVFASVETLDYLRRSGRMNGALARLGEILQIKPLLHMHEGRATAHRARTSRRAHERLLEWLREYSPYERLAVVHAGVRDKAEQLRQEAARYLPLENIPIIQITPVLGAHLGTGALGIAGLTQKG